MNLNEKIWLHKLQKKKSVFLNQKHELQRNYDFNTLSQRWECIYARSHFYTSANTYFHTFIWVDETCDFLKGNCVFCVFNDVFIWMKTRLKLRKSLNHIGGHALATARVGTNLWRSTDCHLVLVSEFHSKNVEFRS